MENVTKLSNNLGNYKVVLEELFQSKISGLTLVIIKSREILKSICDDVISILFRNTIQHRFSNTLLDYLLLQSICSLS